MIAAALVAVGYASWFTPYQRVYDGGYYCAMPSRSMIRRRVRIVAGKRHQTCRVIGTGPFVPGRVIDVSPLVRDDLHMLQPGVISVKIYLLP